MGILHRNREAKKRLEDNGRVWKKIRYYWAIRNMTIGLT